MDAQKQLADTTSRLDNVMSGMERGGAACFPRHRLRRSRTPGDPGVQPSVGGAGAEVASKTSPRPPVKGAAAGGSQFPTRGQPLSRPFDMPERAFSGMVLHYLYPLGAGDKSW